MNGRSVSFILVVFAMAVVSSASEPMARERAREIALDWIESHRDIQPRGTGKLQIASRGTVVVQETEIWRSGTLIGYLEQVSPDAFVFIAPEDAVDPILAYSVENTLNLDNIPPALENWLEDARSYVEYMAAAGRAANSLPSNSLGDGYAGKQNVSTSYHILSDLPLAAGPLLTTIWHQRNPYNMYCPSLSSVNVTFDDASDSEDISPCWSNSDPQWFVDFSDARGVCVRSGTIGALQTTTLTLACRVAQDGSVRFRRKVSGGTGDLLTFRVDDVPQHEWSDTGWGWSNSYSLSEGPHTLEWVYEESDGSGSGHGAWIDDIVLPPVNALVGCGAVAVGQIIHKWKSPGRFKWQDIPDYVNDDSPSEQQDAIAAFLYDCAKAVKSDFGFDETDSKLDDCRDALENIYGYSVGDIRNRDSEGAAEWLRLMKKEVAEDRPVLYRFENEHGGGHFVVLDGYDDGGRVHFNFGWGGSCSGYYALFPNPDVDTGEECEQKGTWNSGHYALIGITPVTCDPNDGSIPGSDLWIARSTWSDIGVDSDSDGAVEAQEEGSLVVSLSARANVSEVSAVLLSPDPRAEIRQDWALYGTIGNSETKQGDKPFKVFANFTIGQDEPSVKCPFVLCIYYEKEGQAYYQDLTFWKWIDYQGDRWGWLVTNNYSLVDSAAIMCSNNNDGVLQSGESVFVRPEVQNKGQAMASNVRISLAATGSAVTVADNWVFYPDVHANGMVYPLGSGFRVAADSCFTGPFDFDVRIMWSEGPSEGIVLQNALSLNVEPVPWISTDYRTWDMGVKGTAQEVRKTISVQNTGTSELSVTGVMLEPAIEGVTYEGPELPWGIVAGARQNVDLVIDTSKLPEGLIDPPIEVRFESDGRVDAGPPPSDTVLISGMVSDAPQASHIPGSTIHARCPDVSGTVVVWEEEGDIVGFDLATHKTCVFCDANGEQSHARVSSDVVAWDDNRNVSADVYAYDRIKGTEVAVANTGAEEQLIGVDSSQVAFVRGENGLQNLHVYDIATGTSARVTNHQLGSSRTTVTKGDFGGGVLAWVEEVSVYRDGSWEYDHEELKMCSGGSTSTVAVSGVGERFKGLSCNAGQVAYSALASQEVTSKLPCLQDTYFRVGKDRSPSRSTDVLAGESRLIVDLPEDDDEMQVAFLQFGTRELSNVADSQVISAELHMWKYEGPNVSSDLEMQAIKGTWDANYITGKIHPEWGMENRGMSGGDNRWDDSGGESGWEMSSLPNVGWVTGSANYGICIQPLQFNIDHDNPMSEPFQFFSQDHPNASLRPFIEVVWRGKPFNQLLLSAGVDSIQCTSGEYHHTDPVLGRGFVVYRLQDASGAEYSDLFYHGMSKGTGAVLTQMAADCYRADGNVVVWEAADGIWCNFPLQVDLAVLPENLTLDSASIRESQPFGLTATVSNVSNLDYCGLITVRAYDGNPDAGGHLLGFDIQVDANVKAHEELAVTFENLVVYKAGLHTLYVRILPGDENVPINNTAAVQIRVRSEGEMGNTFYVDDNGPQDPAPGTPDVSDPLEDGSQEHPFDSIEEALYMAIDGDAIILLEGEYTGQGNRDIDFGGKAVTIRSQDGPESCTIRCGGSLSDSHNGFSFTHGESSNSILDGVTIRDGYQAMGGAIYCSGSNPTITRCVIVGNSAESGGGIWLGSGAATVSNCIIANNTAASGGGIHLNADAGSIMNCTIVSNTASQGGGVNSSAAVSRISNCIIWDNSLNQIASETQDVPYVVFCCVQGGWPGEGNFSMSPLFVDSAAGDFHAKSAAGRWDPTSTSWLNDAVTSPCIDAGDPATAVGEEPSPNGSRINIGAYGGTVWASKSAIIAAPRVRTDPPGWVETDSAKLRGTVEDGGGTYCECGFMYGRASESQDMWTYVECGTYATGESFSHVVCDLKCGMEYDYRAVAENTAGVAVGSTEIFRAASCDAPDLRGWVCDVSAYQDTTWGSSVYISFQVKNQGSVPADNFAVDFYLSADHVWGDADDCYLGSSMHGALAADIVGPPLGASFWLPDAQPHTEYVGDTYYIGMLTDVDDDVSESDETNNGPGDYEKKVDWDTIVIPPPNHPPVLDPIGNRPVVEGTPLTFTISATDEDGDALTYEAENLPSGAQFSGQTFSWTPSIGQAGDYPVTFTVTDGKGGSDSEPITITVTGEGPAYAFVGSVTCHDVDDSPPYLPIGETSTFSDSEIGEIHVRAELANVTRPLVLRIKYISPSGTPVATWDYTIPDPKGSGFDRWEWYVIWHQPGDAIAEVGGWTYTIDVDAGAGFVLENTAYFEVSEAPGPFEIVSTNWEDPDGDDDGVMEAGESVRVKVCLRNTSDQTLEGFIEAYLSTTDGQITITDNQFHYDTFAPGAMLWPEGWQDMTLGFTLTAPATRTSSFTLRLVYTAGEQELEFSKVFSWPGNH